jgi:hypothetical protein
MAGYSSGTTYGSWILIWPLSLAFAVAFTLSILLSTADLIFRRDETLRVGQSGFALASRRRRIDVPWGLVGDATLVRSFWRGSGVLVRLQGVESGALRQDTRSTSLLVRTDLLSTTAAWTAAVLTKKSYPTAGEAEPPAAS